MTLRHRFRTVSGKDICQNNLVSVRVSKLITDTDEIVNLSSQLIIAVSDVPGIVDFIHDRRGDVFFKWFVPWSLLPVIDMRKSLNEIKVFNVTGVPSVKLTVIIR